MRIHPARVPSFPQPGGRAGGRASQPNSTQRGHPATNLRTGGEGIGLSACLYCGRRTETATPRRSFAFPAGICERLSPHSHLPQHELVV